MSKPTGEIRLRAKRSLLLSAAGLILPATAVPVLAQDQGPTSAETYSNDIIVTAQRRAERLEDVPMTVTALSNDALTAANVDSMKDLTKVVTGIQIGQQGAFPAPAVRGVTTLTNGTSFENNVALYVDGFYEPASQVINIDLPNVESIQVLKGPQGTLYGRNATGGAILLNTISPKDYWQGKAELTYARFDDKRASAYVAGPLSDVFGVSVAGYIRRSDGYVGLVSRDPARAREIVGHASPLEQDAVRIKLKADLTENFTAILAYNYTHTSDNRGNLFTPFENLGSLYNSNVPSPTVAALTRPTEFGTAAFDGDVRIETFTHQGTLTLTYDTDIGTIKSYTGFTSTKPITSYDLDGVYNNANWAISVFRQKTWQQAIDFTTKPIDSVDLIVGGTYFNDNLRSIDPYNIVTVTTPCAGIVGCVVPPATTAAPISTFTPTSMILFRQRKEAFGVYLDATWHATDALHITVGGRYSTETQNVFATRLNPVTGVVDFAPTDKSSKYSKFTPRASIRYELSPRTNVYFTYQQGFRSGAWNASLPVAPLGPNEWLDVGQEIVDSFELGFKTAGDNFRAELSGFYYIYKGLQVSATQTFNTSGGQVFGQVLANAPTSKIYGIEGSFEWEPVENFTVRAGATWLHARYGDNFLFPTVGVNPTAPINVVVSTDPLRNYVNQSQLQNLSGLRMARAPDFTANLGFQYDIPDRDGGFRFATNLYYTSKYVLRNPSIWCEPLASNGNCGAGTPNAIAPEVARQQRFIQPAYALLSASVTWTHPSGNFYAKAWGNNLTDHRYPQDKQGLTFPGGTYMPMAEPRTYGATIGAKF